MTWVDLTVIITIIIMMITTVEDMTDLTHTHLVATVQMQNNQRQRCVLLESKRMVERIL